MEGFEQGLTKGDQSMQPLSQIHANFALRQLQPSFQNNSFAVTP